MAESTSHSSNPQHSLPAPTAQREQIRRPRPDTRPDTRPATETPVATSQPQTTSQSHQSEPIAQQLTTTSRPEPQRSVEPQPVVAPSTRPERPMSYEEAVARQRELQSDRQETSNNPEE